VQERTDVAMVNPVTAKAITIRVIFSATKIKSIL
jgi:hypothetical protein